MNKLFTAAAAIAFAGFATAAHAAPAGNTSNSVALNGTVATTCSIDVKALNPALDLVNGEKATAVAEITETCNSGKGYDVSFSSANDGTLVSEADGTAPAAYTVAYDGETGDLAQSDWKVSRDVAGFGKKATLAVSIDAHPEAIGGDYADTITVQIAAK